VTTKKVKTIVEIMSAKKGLKATKIALMKAEVTKLEEGAEDLKNQIEDQDHDLHQLSITRMTVMVESSIALKRESTLLLAIEVVPAKLTGALDLKETGKLTRMVCLSPTYQDLLCSIINLPKCKPKRFPTYKMSIIDTKMTTASTTLKSS